MTDWDRLRSVLADVDHTLTMSWAELVALVGPLPTSARRHPAYWSGERSQWRGFRATNVRVGEEVTFERRSGDERPIARSAPIEPIVAEDLHTAAPGPRPIKANDGLDPSHVLLMTCVKSKLNRTAPARDLYISPLFKRQRAYAERTGSPWFILSAEHGLVTPDQPLAPYERYLPDTSLSYRTAWGAWVVERLALLHGPLDQQVVEVHASAAYVDAISHHLAAHGATPQTPLHGLNRWERVHWYDRQAREASELWRRFALRLTVYADTVSPDEFLERGGGDLNEPGLYSWWVDDAGAADLARGLGQPITPGLVYAGLAGATKWPSGKRSAQTLWTRIKGNHIGGRHRASTFRLTLGAVLATARQEATIDEEALTAWMYDHLRVLALPYADADTLGQLEDDVLSAIDPPLNLEGMPSTSIRRRLTELRRTHSDRRNTSLVADE